MALTCPPKHTAEYKSLVKDLGDDDLAHIAYFRNGDVLPDAARARELLGMAGGKENKAADLPKVEKERDNQYLELAKDPKKNRDALQRMVDARAKEAG